MLDTYQPTEKSAATYTTTISWHNRIQHFTTVANDEQGLYKLASLQERIPTQ